MDAELSALLNSILWGKRYINVKDGNKRNHILIAKELELQDKVWIDFIYKQALTDGETNGLMPSSELAVFLDNCGVWTKKDNKEIQNLKISLAKIGGKLEEDISKREKEVTLRLRDRITKELNKKEGLKSAHFVNSIETYANTQRLNASVFSSLYADENNKYWERWDNFLNEVDSDFVGNATLSVFNKNRLTVTQVRKIARSSQWRFRWNAYKSSGDLFGKPLMELTVDQDSLIYWSQVYDAAYESMDRPSQEVIDDDKLLDAWFEEQGKKRKLEEIKKDKGPNRIGSSKIWRHSEIGIVTNNVIESDLNRARKLGIAKHTSVPTTQEVNDLNSPLSKKLRAHERKKLKKYGMLEERDMRSDANSRRAIGSKDVVFKKAKRKDGFTGKRVVDTKPGGTIMGKRAL